MLRRVWLLTGITLIAASAGADSIAVDWLLSNPLRDKRPHHKLSAKEWFKEDVIKRLNITGNEDLGAHFQQVIGDTVAYDQLNYFGTGGQTFTSLGTMTVSGQHVADLINLDFSFADNQYLDPAAHRLTAEYSHEGLKIDAGDIYASMIGGNRFMQLQRELRGATVQYSRGGLTIKGIVSESTSSVTTTSFNGNNSPGPYYLQTSELIADSVQLQVDGRPMQLGTDYTIDAVAGTITFTSLSVAPTSTIVVSYESDDINGNGGSVTGLGLQYNMGRLGRFDVSELRQTDPTGSQLITTTDRYQGYGDASVPYILQYIPVATQPVIVALNGITQTAGVDYQFSSSNPTVFYFLYYVPSTSTVTVTYTPQSNSGIQGNREVEGFDYTLPFGPRAKLGSITYSFAHSQLDNPITPMSGNAQGINGQFKYKGFSLTADYDDIPPTFVGIQSTSFLRNELSTTVSTQYKVNRFTFSADGSNSAISTQATDSSGNLVFQNARTTSLEGGVKYAAESGLTWSLNQQHMTSWGVDGPSYADMSTLSLSKGFGRLNSHVDVDRTVGFGEISDGITTSTGSVQLTSLSLKEDYDALHGWAFDGRVSLSAIDTEGTNGIGTDLAFDFGFHNQKRPFSFDTAYAYSNSGEIATLGSFENGNGVGYNGNGFTSGYTGNTTSAGTGLNAAGTDVRRLALSAAYEVRERLSLGANFLSSAEYGAVATNALTTSEGVSLNYDLHNGQHLTTFLDNSVTQYVGISENANSLSMDMSVGGRPKGPWSYNIQVGALISSGGTIAQNSFHYDFMVRNYFKKNQSVGFEVTSSSLTNYEPQDDFQIALSYEYKFWGNTALVAKYQVHNVTNLDPTVIGGAYQSHGLNIDLNFNFNG